MKGDFDAMLALGVLLAAALAVGILLFNGPPHDFVPRAVLL